MKKEIKERYQKLNDLGCIICLKEKVKNYWLDVKEAFGEKTEVEVESETRAAERSQKQRIDCYRG